MKKFHHFLEQKHLVIGMSFVVGCLVLGYTLGNSLLAIKNLDRTVTVKGLAEKEVEADMVIWRIMFKKPSNDLTQLYLNINNDIKLITNFMETKGIVSSEISIAPPNIIDRDVQIYGEKTSYRYIAEQNITIYSSNVNLVRELMTSLQELGKQGISFSGNAQYDRPAEYLYTRLNDIKPEMIQEATENAREVAMKFADDSKSRLGKIKTASQGQFSINDRDRNTPYIKKIRVVSTIEYYLSD